MIDKFCIFWKTVWKAATKEDKVFCLSFLVGVLSAVVLNYVVPLPPNMTPFPAHFAHKTVVIVGSFVFGMIFWACLDCFIHWFEGFCRKFDAYYYGVEQAHKAKKDEQKDKMQQEIDKLRKEIKELMKK